MKLTEKSQSVFDYVKANGKVTIAELATALERTDKSVGANVTDLTKKGLAVRIKEAVEGEEKPVTYVELTEEGLAFVPSVDEE